MMGLSDYRNSFPIGLAVLIQYRSVTDTQPATQPRCRSYYAQHSGVEKSKRGDGGFNSAFPLTMINTASSTALVRKISKTSRCGAKVKTFSSDVK